MTRDVTFANARLILPDDVVTGALSIRDGVITDIAPGGDIPAGAIDCGGDYIAPGLIELHTDNLERHISPRPKANWPHRAAILAHDRELAGCGITTVFDALRVGSVLRNEAHSYKKYARQLADEILETRAHGALKISHHIHLRAEVCSETLLEELAEFSPEDRVGLVSLMDHTPGQRQFRDVSKLYDYMHGKHGMTEAQFEEHVQQMTALRARLGDAHEAGAVREAARLGATLASHDDTTEAQVATSADHGIRLAEFPTTIEAARAGHSHGILNIMGAPNLVRGGSHSGNVAASDLAAQDLLDIVSSDYVPSALLLAAVVLGGQWNDLARGIATATRSPAEAVGLTDRGALMTGRRGDVIRFAMELDAPMLLETWVEGKRVA